MRHVEKRAGKRMRECELALKAAADPTRMRILKLLEAGALCVSQIQRILELAPSTTSKHLTTLKMAGLVEARRKGKWVEFTLTKGAQNPYVRPVLALLGGSLDREAMIVADRQRLRRVKSIPLAELCETMPGKIGGGIVALRARKSSRKERRHA